MKKTIVTLVDDLDPTGQTEAVETVHFALDGVTYEIDLSAENAHTLRARLKEFRQAARVIKGTPKRAVRPPAEPAVATAPTRHQSGTTPTDITTWAIEKGLREPGKRGRVSNTIKEAYAASRAGDDGPLNELRALLRAVGRSTEPVEQLDHSAAHAAVAAAEAKSATSAPADSAEEEARKHYRAIIRSARVANDKTWMNRVASGCPRVDKVEQMTLVERINALTDKNVTMLGQLAGIVPLKNGKVSHLSGSAARLENLEVIEEDKNNPLGWVITEFGRYAHEMRSL